MIGGPPCQFASVGNRGHSAKAHENLIPEFERVVAEARPGWFLMENVPQSPLPSVPEYIVNDVLLENRWLAEVQMRKRRFSFGSQDGRVLLVQLAALEAPRARGLSSLIGRGGLTDEALSRRALP